MPLAPLLQKVQAEAAGLKAALSQEQLSNRDLQERIDAYEASLLHDNEPTLRTEVRLTACMLSRC